MAHQNFRHKSRARTNALPCIFVHAGAGFHSLQNEQIHLKACNDAATAGMNMLRLGGTAVDAVEFAIKVLEDREVTNAGYGSNLAMDGSVECDAVIVDHDGRSGGVGAVSQIKNPIQLARVIYDKSAQPLSLRRVPPNFLVGKGATDFAFEQGFSIVPHELLVSPAARDRWLRWREELREAEGKGPTKLGSGLDSLLGHVAGNERRSSQTEQEQSRRAQIRGMEQGLFNEAQPMTPPPSDLPPSDLRGSLSPKNSRTHSERDRDGPFSFSDSESSVSNEFLDAFDSTQDFEEDDFFGAQTDPIEIDGGTDRCESLMQNLEIRPRRRTSSVRGDDRTEHEKANSSFPQPDSLDGNQDKLDHITDTVGAIAIDIFGHIACGASSGGIGMKHKGRVGPAAQVGVGASVFPPDPKDPARTCVATVTSGTGEHMATTMAASTCTSRIYYCQRKLDRNIFEEVTEDEAICGFINTDFVHHPSVLHSTTTGAIGVLTVKMAKAGAWLYFAHNTESFALSSMIGTDTNPTATMSRKGQGNIAQGGRAIKFASRSR